MLRDKGASDTSDRKTPMSNIKLTPAQYVVAVHHALTLLHETAMPYILGTKPITSFEETWNSIKMPIGADGADLFVWDTSIDLDDTDHGTEFALVAYPIREGANGTKGADDYDYCDCVFRATFSIPDALEDTLKESRAQDLESETLTTLTMRQ